MAKRPVYINRKKRNKQSMLLPSAVVVMVALLVAFTGATVWQTLSGDDARLEAKQSMSQALEASFGSQAEESASSQAEQSEPGAPPESSSEGDAAGESSAPQESSGAAGSKPDAPAGAVPKGERVSSSYFDDAMFIGDSITDGILSYQLMENAEVIAYTGINPDTIRTKEVYRNSEGKLITVLDAMKENSDCTKIYILLGSNGIAWLDEEHFIQSYEEFLKEVQQQHPDAVIYVQSIPPINETLFPQHYSGDITNEKITQYNRSIAEMAQRVGVYYLNIAEVFADENGELPTEATTDGMHFSTTYYQKWFDYLKTHTVAG